MATAAHYETQFIPEGAHFYNLKQQTSPSTSKGILAATIAYMNALTQAFSAQTYNSMSQTDIISKLMQSYTTSASDTQKQVMSELQQISDEESSSGLFGKIVSYLFGGLMVVSGALTGDFAEVMIGAGSIAMQASGAQQKLADALGSGGDLLAPLIISAGEMAIGGGLSTAYQIGQGAIENSVCSVVAQLSSSLAQGLMVNNFWGAVASKVNNPVGSVFLGLALAVGTTMLAGMWASKYAIEDTSEEKGSWLLRKLKSKFPDGKGETLYQNIMTGLKLFKHTMQMGIGVTQILGAQSMLKAAETLKESAETQKQYSIYQNCSAIADAALNIAQGGQGAITQNFSSIMQSFSQLGQLYAPQKNN